MDLKTLRKYIDKEKTGKNWIDGNIKKDEHIPPVENNIKLFRKYPKIREFKNAAGIEMVYCPATKKPEIMHVIPSKKVRKNPRKYIQII